MKKIFAVFILALIMAVLSACSARHGGGYVNNELAYRADFDGMRAEVSLGVTVDNDFGDSITDLPGLMYKSEQTGSVAVNIDLGLAYYYTVFKNDIFNVSAGIKYRNHMSVDYNYFYYYETYVGVRKYHYDEELTFGYFSQNSVSFIFPDVEIQCPFLTNMKFTVGVELLYMRWNYAGGKYVSTFTQEVYSNSTGYSESTEEELYAPGGVSGVSFGSDIFSLGGIHAGIIYYF